MADAVIQRQMALLRDRVGRFFGNRARERRRLLDTLNTMKGFAAPVFLFGGVVRDLMIHGATMSPRDVDLVVSTVDLRDVTAAFSESFTRRNRFGGLHLTIEGWHFDVWPLAQTWAFRENIFSDASFENLPKTTFLNIEAIAVRLDTEERRYREVHSHGFFEALSTRTLEINSEANPYPSLCVLRSLIMAETLRFSVGPKLANYICEHANVDEVDELMRVQWEHYKRQPYDSDTLKSWLAAVVRQRRLTKRSPVQLPHRPKQLSFIEASRPRTGNNTLRRQQNRVRTWR